MAAWTLTSDGLKTLRRNKTIDDTCEFADICYAGHRGNDPICTYFEECMRYWDYKKKMITYVWPTLEEEHDKKNIKVYTKTPKKT